MTHREFFIERWEAEFPATVRVFKALPADKLDYRPHPRSRSAGELVALLVGEEKAAIQICDEFKCDWTEPTGIGTLPDMITEFEKYHRVLGEKLKKFDEAAWDKRVGFFMGGKQLMEESAGAMFWSFLLDAIHHRGQLSVYIRPMGGKVPSIYGPSADDSGM